MLFLSFSMQLCLIQSRPFSPQPLASLSKDLLSSFSSSSLSHSFLSLSARCPGLNFLCTRTLPFQKQLWEQPKTQRETEHCIDRLSKLHCSNTDGHHVLWGNDACLFTPMFVYACVQSSGMNSTCLCNVICAFSIQNPMYAACMLYSSCHVLWHIHLSAHWNFYLSMYSYWDLDGALPR